MSISLLVAVAFADCPPIAASLRRAEEDVVAYFIADAETALQQAATGFGCSTTTREELVRFWLVQAMIWDLAGDERADRALAAARALDPEQFTTDLGQALQTRWTETPPAALSPAIDLRIRGLRAGDRVLVDGQPASPPTTPPGLHVVQVARGDEIVLGRVLDAEVGDPITVRLTDNGASPTTSTAGPTLDYTLPTPLTLENGLRDANGVRRDFAYEVVPAALTRAAGRELHRERRTNAGYQVAASSLAVLGAYGTYLASWKYLHDDQGRGVSGGAALGLGLAAVGGVTWEIGLQRRRRATRAELVGLANEALGAGAP
jgi:hypothetical protein